MLIGPRGRAGATAWLRRFSVSCRGRERHLTHQDRTARIRHRRLRRAPAAADGAESIERVTGQPVEVAAALVRDPARHADAPEGVLTTDFARLRDDPTISVVAEVMGGIEHA